MVLKNLEKEIAELDAELKNLQNLYQLKPKKTLFNNCIDYYNWLDKDNEETNLIEIKEKELEELKLKHYLINNGLNPDVLVNPNLIEINNLKAYAKFKGISISDDELNKILDILSKSIFFKKTLKNNVNFSQNVIQTHFNSFKSFDTLLESFSILNTYHPKKSYNAEHYLNTILNKKASPELEQRYLDNRVELTMIKHIHYNIAKGTNNINFDINSDVYSTGNSSKSQVEVILNNKNIQKIKVECKRIDLSVYNELKRNNIEMDMDAIYDKTKIPLNHAQKDANLIKAHDVMVKKISARIQKSKEQLSQNFKKSTKNIFYCSIDGFKLSDKDDYSELSLLMHHYYLFSQHYKEVTKISSPSHYQKITNHSDFNINLRNQKIDYIFISFSDTHIVWKITAKNTAKIIYSSQADKETREFLIK